MQYSVHSPSEFIRRHAHQLLPNWSCSVRSVLVVLQRCQVELQQKTIATEFHKRQLRQRSLEFGQMIILRLHKLGYQAELFDPKTGMPILSQPGKLTLDDVAVVRACLGYPITEREGCSIILHPAWGSAVYPAILLSSAHPAVLAGVIETTDWQPLNFEPCC